MGYLFILLAVGAAEVEHTLQKTYKKKHGNGAPILFTSFVALFSFLFFLGKYLITDTSKGDFTPAIIPYALAGAFCYCVASVAACIAYQTGPFAITSLIFSFSIMITSAAGIVFFEEAYSYLTFIGFALVVVSIILVSPIKLNFRRTPEQNAEKPTEKKKFSKVWLITVILNVVLSPTYSIITKLQQKTFDNTVNNEFIIMAIGISAFVLLGTGIFMAKGEALSTIKKCAPYAATAGVANGFNNMLGLILNTLLPLSIISPTRSIVSKLVTYSIAFFAFKERFSKRQIAGIVIGAVAVLLINIATLF